MARRPNSFPPPSRKACAGRSIATLAGQAQKEFFINQAFAILDAHSQGAVLASVNEPPPSFSDGDCYRVTAPADGAWLLHADHVAISIGGAWHFVAPAEGAQLFDRAAGQWLFFRSGWQAAGVPELPEGGTVIDVEARSALLQLIASLQAIGVLAAVCGFLHKLTIDAFLQHRSSIDRLPLQWGKDREPGCLK